MRWEGLRKRRWSKQNVYSTEREHKKTNRIRRLKQRQATNKIAVNAKTGEHSTGEHFITRVNNVTNRRQLK